MMADIKEPAITDSRKRAVGFEISLLELHQKLFKSAGF